MAGKWVESAPDPEGTAAVTPGPGEHHQQGWSSLGGPAFTLAGKAAATVLQENTPGPGETSYQCVGLAGEFAFCDLLSHS